ncbi:MAG: adenine deaminase [Proteobacteria bacterium]|nr:adenine deaminase [Pseudomonadota bacterium]
MAVTVLHHQVADVVSGIVRPCTVTVRDGRIASIVPATGPVDPGVLVPGFVDAHVHVESSMLPPWEFARIAMRHGTVASVSDPHEIANVLGEPGVRYMLEDIAGSPFTCWFGCPSCVPATGFETAGATLDADACARLLSDPGIHYLSEMMNWPGAIAGDGQVLAKIAAAKARSKRVDGHAPGLRGEQARAYFARGIETDHECFTLDEARDKAALGVRILIREGSAARNFDALWPLLREHPELCMFCTDDAHPDDLLVGHLDRLLARSVANGIEPMAALRAATLHPVRHYGLPCGLLQLGDRADMVLVDDLQGFRVRRTWIAGQVVAEEGVTRIAPRASGTPNAFRAAQFRADDFVVRAPASCASGATVQVHAIVAEDGQLVTKCADVSARTSNGKVEPDPSSDLLQIAVVNRYSDTPIATAFVRGFGLKRGAIASSVAHDCHNVVAVGASCEAIAAAVNAVFAGRGGLAVADGDAVESLALPIAGLMSDRPAEEVGASYARLSARAKALGSPLRAPFMTAGFMALLVIPALKLSDRGLFDGTKFEFTPAVSC